MANHVAIKNDLMYPRSRKAWNAGITAAAAAAGSVSVAGLFTEHGIDGAAVGVAAGAVVTAFVGTFLVTFFSPNAS